MPVDLLSNVPNINNQTMPQGKDLLPDMNTVQDPTVEQSGSFMAAVEGFNRSFGRLAEGVLQAASPILPETFNRGVDLTNQQAEASYQQTSEQHPIASKAGELTGYISQGLVTPIAKGTLAKQITSLALTGGVLGALEYGSGSDRLVRGVTGAAAGAAGGYLLNKFVSPSIATSAGETVDDVGIVSKMFNPEQAAAKNITNQIIEAGGADQIAARNSAAKALDVNLTPGQVLGDEAVLKAESRIPITNENMRVTGSEFLKQQSSKLKMAVNNIVDGIVPEGDAAAKAAQKSAYDKLATLNIDTPTQSQLLSNPVIADELKNLNTNRYTTQVVKDLADTSVLKLDKVKQEIDRSLYKDVSISSDPNKVMGAETRRALQEARKMIVDTLDNAYPEYAATRKLSERIILKSDIQDAIKQIGAKPGKLPNEVSLDQIYKKLWDTPEKQDLFLDRLTSAGGDSQYASNVMTVMNQVRNSPIAGMLKRSNIEDNNQLFGSSLTYRIASFLNKLTEGKYNTEYLNLITNNKKWENEVNKLLESKSQNTLIMGFKQLLNKAGSSLNNMFENATNPKQ